MIEIEKKNKNYIHIVFIILFIITFIVYLITHIINNLGLFFDIPSVFFGTINMDYEGNTFGFYKLFVDNNTRLFTNLLVSIPYNILSPIFAKDSILFQCNLYSLSYLITQGIFLIINYYVAKRTKRYDIAIIAFAFYCIFSLPNMLWSIREIHIAVLSYFPILSYFLTKEKLNKKDLIPIFILCLYLFESFEITFAFGIILFLFLHIYSNKKDSPNMWYKVLIGIMAFLASLWIPVKLLYVHLRHSSVLGNGIQEWINGSLTTLHYFFQSNSIIVFFAIIAIIITLFCKKQFNKKSIIPIFLYLSITYFILYKITNFYSSPLIELHSYSIIVWFIFPTILTILFCDYFDKRSPIFYSNLLIITCIFGITNLSWQIHSNIEFGKYISYLQNRIESSTSTYTYIDENDYNKYQYISRYNTCFGLIQRSLLLAKEKEVKTIIMPSKYFCDYSKFCYDDKENTVFNKVTNTLKLQCSNLPTLNRYWDFTKIIEQFILDDRITNE